MMSSLLQIELLLGKIKSKHIYRPQGAGFNPPHPDDATGKGSLSLESFQNRRKLARLSKKCLDRASVEAFYLGQKFLHFKAYRI